MTLAEQQPPPPRVKRWTKREYNDLVAKGAFSGQHIYLFRGELIEMSPQYRPHAFAVTALNEVLHLAFGIRQGFKLRPQLPFEVPGDSMPEPDLLVCTDAQHLRVPHPDQAVLVIEVADSSLRDDHEKALEYAGAQVPEYWIVDVNRRQVELYRHPAPDATARHGFRYPPPQIIAATESIELLSKPGAAIAVAELFI
jgi:Uma2 family endonuclease